MLELIREYALEHCADADVIGARHAEYFVELVERAEPELRSARRDRYGLARLSGERDNVRAALRRLIDTPPTGRMHIASSPHCGRTGMTSARSAKPPSGSRG